MTSLAMTRTRVHRWATVFTRLASILDHLQSREDRPLARSLAHLLQRAMDPFEGVKGDLVPHEFIAESMDVEPMAGDLLAGLQRCQGIGDRSSAPGAEELHVLIALAEAYGSCHDDGEFSSSGSDSESLAQEFRALPHMDAEGQGPGLLPEPMRRAWALLGEESRSIPEPEKQLQFDLARMRVIRALYSLAIGHRIMGSRPFLDAENLLLVHRLGETMLTARPAQAGGGF